MGSFLNTIKTFFCGSSCPAGQTQSAEKKYQNVVRPNTQVSTPADQPSQKQVRIVITDRDIRSPSTVTANSTSPVKVLSQNRSSIAKPYWMLRRWRHVGDNVYIGYFKTRLGRRHGVIKWNSRYDFNFYIHDVPLSILNGPHGACFAEVKPGKYRVHFAQLPQDLNCGIFYLETLLQEGLET